MAASTNVPESEQTGEEKAENSGPSAKGAGDPASASQARAVATAGTALASGRTAVPQPRAEPPVSRGPAVQRERIVKPDGTTEEDIAARRPVYRPPNRAVKPKIGKNVLGCFLYILLVLAVAAAIVMVAVAKSGIVAVPFVSQFYVGPTPTRTVQAGTEKPEELLKAVRSAITEGNVNVRAPHRVEYTEAELTAAARGALADAGKRGEVDASRTQVVIRPDAVQLTSRFRVKGIMIDVQIEILPTVENGALKMSITKARFGDIPVAPALAKLALDSALGRDSSTWNLQIAEHDVQSVRLEDQALELTLY